MGELRCGSCRLNRVSDILYFSVYMEHTYYAPIIIRTQKLKLANDMMRHLIKSQTMSGEMRPMDAAAVLAPNKEGRMQFSQ